MEGILLAMAWLLIILAPITASEGTRNEQECRQVACVVEVAPLGRPGPLPARTERVARAVWLRMTSSPEWLAGATASST